MSWPKYCFTECQSTECLVLNAEYRVVLGCVRPEDESEVESDLEAVLRDRMAAA